MPDLLTEEQLAERYCFAVGDGSCGDRPCRCMEPPGHGHDHSHGVYDYSGSGEHRWYRKASEYVTVIEFRRRFPDIPKSVAKEIIKTFRVFPGSKA